MRFLLLSIMIALCGSSVFAEDDYCPLHVGDESLSDMKAVYPNGATVTGTIRDWITEGVEVNGKKYLRSHHMSSLRTDKRETTTLVRKDSTGLYVIREYEKEDTESLDIALPLKVGNTQDFVMNKKHRHTQVLALETVTIGDNVYENCFHLHMTTEDGSFTEDIWLAPNIGQLKTEATYSDGRKVTYTLRESKPGK